MEHLTLIVDGRKVEVKKGKTPANRLTNPALDPVAKIPEFKVCAVNINKIYERRAS